MSSAPVSGVTPTEIVRILSTHRKRWIVPMIACSVLSVVYALVMTRYWEASQAMVVRQEATSASTEQPGKFSSLYDMRTLQETILELAKSRHVVVATLQSVNNANGVSASEPTNKDVQQFRKRLKMLPPDGAEFGKTEVFYFSVKDPSRERALQLVGALCDQLDARLGQLRDERAQSLVAELEKRVELAKSAHAVETQRLNAYESKLGADLGELRMLQSAFSGQSDLRQQLVQLESESRQHEARTVEAEQLLEFLQDAKQNPERLVALPNSLLASQPTLNRLKNGLVDAQLRTARLGGTRLPEHPRMQAAVASEERIRRDLHRELQTAVAAAQVDVELYRQRQAKAEKQLQNVQNRLGNLAEQRAEYSNRIAAVESSRAVLDRTRQSLSQVSATRAAAHTASLVSRIDTPETGLYPTGPGRSMVVATGTVCGLILGLGWVFLTVGPPAGFDRVNANGTVRTGKSNVGPQPKRDVQWCDDSSALSHSVLAEEAESADQFSYAQTAVIPDTGRPSDENDSCYPSVPLGQAFESLGNYPTANR